ncbi:HEPN domain-containing protein [Salipaludibacillus sp. CF4.18]|uniref:HEPN domain-containing protein n=1 Tax=Salipaludibacillus sp. CF4.18 TaxID=3373081 RepID=UPI003EE684C1
MPTISELKYLSKRRLETAEILSQNGIYDIAYQDSGYILEFGLKAVICKHLEQGQYPDHDRRYRTHHFDSLVHHAGLAKELSEKSLKIESL